jgi:pimeloyl-ACP methyl ester carboxylesterase
LLQDFGEIHAEARQVAKAPVASRVPSNRVSRPTSRRLAHPRPGTGLADRRFGLVRRAPEEIIMSDLLPARASRRFSPWPLLLATAAVLGASAWVARRMVKRAQADHPARGSFVLVDDVRLHFTVHGQPRHPPLVLLHGNGGSADEMELSGLVAAAAQRYRVYVFDRPGYGHSERPPHRSFTPNAQAALLLHALRVLEVRQPIVLGHSWGALVALAMALREPGALRSVVLASGYFTPSLRLDTAWLSAPALPVIGTLMRHTLSPVIGRLLWPLMLRRVFAPAPVPERFRRGFPVWLSLRPLTLKASAMESAMLPLQAAWLRPREKDVTVPVVVVAGEKDRLVMTRWQSGRLVGRLPDATLKTVPGAGHMVHHTATAHVLAAIDEAAARAESPVPVASPS